MPSSAIDTAVRRCPTCDVLVEATGEQLRCRHGHSFARDDAMALVPCQGCCESHPQSIPGVRYPTASNGDESKAWIERCDDCEEYESDADAADALVKSGRIHGWRRAVPAGAITPTPYATTDEAAGSFA